MSAWSIGEVVAPIVARARALSKLQAFLEESQSREWRKAVAVALAAEGLISAEAAELLIEFNQLEAV